MKDITLKRSVWSICFLIALTLYMLGATLESTMFGQMIWPNKINDLFKTISMAILAIGALIHIKRYLLEELIIFGVLGIISAICYITNGSAAPILMLLFWVNMKEVEIDDVLYVYLGTTLFALISAVVLCIIGLIPNRVVNGGCDCLGYGYSNGFGAAWMCIVMTYLAIRKNAASWLETGICIAGTVIMYIFCESSTSLVICAIAIFANIVLSITDKKWVDDAIYILGIAICPLMICITHASVIFYTPDNAIWEKLNRLVTGRLGLGQYGMQTYGAKTFGQRINWFDAGESLLNGAEGSYNIVDSSYLSILITYGAVFFVILIILYVLFGSYSKKKLRREWSIILVMVGLGGFVEGTLISININPVLIGIGILFYQSCEMVEQVVKVNVSDILRYIYRHKAVAIFVSMAIAIIVVAIGNKDPLYYTYVKESVTKYEDYKIVMLAMTGMLFGIIASIVGLSFIKVLFKKDEK